jgi:predicted metal-binding membrane protein
MTGGTTVAATLPSRAAGRVGARRLLIGVAMYAVAAVAWWSSATASMPVGLAAFMFGWLVMMTAMMLPALAPVVTLYQRAARRRTVAPVPVFLVGYLLVWMSAGIPAYVAWQRLQPAQMDGLAWTGRVAGAALLVAALYQLTPLKTACLRGCRSPLTAFMAIKGSLSRPTTAVRVGARNGLWCLGCCWALMAVLVAVGVMQPWWMAGIAALIFAEKALPFGPSLTRPIALLLAGFGVLLLANPHLLVTYTTTM